MRNGVFDAESRTFKSSPDGFVPGSIPFWFGIEGQPPPFLSASFEPSGLQVFGALARRDWEQWDVSFQSAASGLPMKRFD
jgi:hypothetical protein